MISKTSIDTSEIFIRVNKIFSRAVPKCSQWQVICCASTLIYYFFCEVSVPAKGLPLVFHTGDYWVWETQAEARVPVHCLHTHSCNNRADNTQ